MGVIQLVQNDVVLRRVNVDDERLDGGIAFNQNACVSCLLTGWFFPLSNSPYSPLVAFGMLMKRTLIGIRVVMKIGVMIS
jgi:hypothetical protein